MVLIGVASRAAQLDGLDELGPVDSHRGERFHRKPGAAGRR